MNINKWTTKAQEALQAMQDLARQWRHQALEPEHFLLALIDQREGVVPALLERMNVDVTKIRQAVETDLERHPSVSGGEPYLSRELHGVIEQAETQARAL